MNINEIKRIIQDQELERIALLKRERIITREVGKEYFINAISVPNILAILGIRRCGKSVLSRNILEGETVAYLNFDDESLYGIKAHDLNNVLKAFYELYGDPSFIILDEIQNVPDWELFANRLRRTKKVIITGSNSNLLSGELATHLTGRHTDFTLFPFSFGEFLNYNKFNLEDEKKFLYSTKAGAKIEDFLTKYILQGGFPENYKLNIAKTIFGDIIQKDVVRRHKIKNVSVIENLAKYLVSNFSQEISFNKLKNVFGIGKIETIKNYVKYIQDAYLIIVVERFSFKLKQQVISPKKIYCIDTGIINSIAFKFIENTGKLMENLVAVELFRRKSYWHNDWEIYYWKDYQQHEVDFIVKDGPDVKQLIQVIYASGKDEIEKRETEGLIKGSEELNCKNLLLITHDYEDEIKIENKTIMCLPLWKWLINVR